MRNTLATGLAARPVNWSSRTSLEQGADERHQLCRLGPWLLAIEENAEIHICRVEQARVEERRPRRDQQE